ncbi:MAG: hypothetical protein OHK0053_17590 [Microscillaceae bacterium]
MAFISKTEQLHERRRRVLAILLTALLGVALLALLNLLKVYYLDAQALEFDYGMQVSYGTDETGTGETGLPIESVRNETEENTESLTNEATPNDPPDIEQVPVSETRTAPEPKPQNNPTNRPQNQPQGNPPPKTTGKDKTDPKKGQGDDPNSPGNKGKETGIDEQGLYKGSGGSGGSSLSLSGWRWEKEPLVNDNSNAEGTIIFDVLVDEEGLFISVKPRYPGTTVADKNLVEKYRRAVLQSYLVADGSQNAANTSRGIVTFVLKAR